MKQKVCCGWKLFKALGDRTRYKIVAALLDGERCACELPRLVKRAQPTVSLQLKYLAKAGIVSSRRQGRMVLYRISDRHREFLKLAGLR